MAGQETVEQAPAKSSVYAEARTVTDLEECYFYHSMEIPGYGLVEGPWDIRGGVDDYLGNVDLNGKRVLEVGTASGFLCYTMEGRGADVVAYDLSDKQSWDVVPYAQYDHASFDSDRREHLRKLNNSWWLAHGAFESSAKVVYGTVYEIPEEIGRVQVATFGNVLRHFRDPFLALERGLRLATETAIVTENPSLRYSLPQMAASLLKPTMAFLPNYERVQPRESWWHFTPAVIKQMLGILGFEDTKVNYHVQRFSGRRNPQFTVVGRRTVPLPD
jgi:methyltransferase family protein